MRKEVPFTPIFIEYEGKKIIHDDIEKFCKFTKNAKHSYDKKGGTTRITVTLPNEKHLRLIVKSDRLSDYWSEKMKSYDEHAIQSKEEDKVPSEINSFVIDEIIDWCSEILKDANAQTFRYTISPDVSIYRDNGAYEWDT